MSPASRAVTRLRKLYRSVLQHMHQPAAPASASRSPRLEPLEPRLLLSGTSFSAQQVISTSLDGAFSVYATDLDGDGDADVLSASMDDDKIAWYENLGSGSFWRSSPMVPTNAFAHKNRQPTWADRL